MGDFTTIQVNRVTIEMLKKLKKHPRESYNEVISDLVAVTDASSKITEHEKFLNEMQKAKMKELWDNKEDEAWERA